MNHFYPNLNRTLAQNEILNKGFVNCDRIFFSEWTIPWKNTQKSLRLSRKDWLVCPVHCFTGCFWTSNHNRRTLNIHSALKVTRHIEKQLPSIFISKRCSREVTDVGFALCSPAHTYEALWVYQKLAASLQTSHTHRPGFGLKDALPTIVTGPFDQRTLRATDRSESWTVHSSLPSTKSFC